MDDGAGVHLFGGQKGKTRAEVEAHLIAEHGQGAGPGAIVLAQSVIAHVAHEIEVGTHGRRAKAPRHCIRCCRPRRVPRPTRRNVRPLVGSFRKSLTTTWRRVR